jgi:uncharacterized protein (DUF2141 family)
LAISRRRIAALALAALALPAASPQTTLEIEVSQLRSHKGVLRICLTADPENFPDCRHDTRSVTRTVPADRPSVRFDGLSAGNWAAAVIHDENANGKLDKAIGIPREGFGFTRNPTITFGPPRFTAASVALAGDRSHQVVRMRYLL